jgi:hypothetical protein
MPPPLRCWELLYVIRKGSSAYHYEFVPLGKMIDLEGFLEYPREKSEELRNGRSKLLTELGLA